MSNPHVIPAARVQRPERHQVEWRPLALDACLPGDHRVRSVWAYVEALDLGPLYGQIRAVEGSAGRDAVDPKILLALWMFATIEGVSSARQLARLCERDLAYVWLRGGVGVNHRLLGEFRAGHGEFLDGLLTDTVATLLHQGLVTLEVAAQDGMRVRANAGSSSFRREKTLEQHREEARRRAAQEREQRVEQALQELAELQRQKEKQKKGSGKEARSSTTDPEARKMKMGDGGYRPAYNVQLATDGATRIIVAADVINSGSDRRQMAPMQARVRERYGKPPGDYLVDCGFATHEDVTAVEQNGSRVLAPIHSEAKMLREGKDPHARQRRDTDQSLAHRQRMATEEAKKLYRQRPGIAEFPNAEFRNRGLGQFRVRGLKKVRAVTLLHALTFNFMRMTHLGFLPG